MSGIFRSPGRAGAAHPRPGSGNGPGAGGLGVPRAARRAAGLRGIGHVLAGWRVLALVTVLAVVAAVVAGAGGVASASVVPHRPSGAGAHAAPGSGLTLAQAPAGLRAAVRKTLGAGAASGGGALQKAKLAPPGGNSADGDQFGFSVAIAGSTAVVGASDCCVANSSAGAAFVFVRSGGTWTQQAELTAANGGVHDKFGASVAISGSTVAVGAWAHNSDTGAVYVFTGSGGTWTQQAELTASNGAPGDEFGGSVAISGSTVVAGAPNADQAGGSAGLGAAYVFTGSGATWAQQAELTGSDPGLYGFGYAVAISGSTVIAGTYSPQNFGQAGRAFVFTSSGGTWAQQATMTAPDHNPGDDFGYSVALSGSTAVVGAPGANSGTGAAYVYADSGGPLAPQATLMPAGAAPVQFGAAVAIAGHTAVVGAYGTNSNSGAAYVFTRSGGTWPQQAQLTDPAGTTGEFGYAVALSGSTAMVGVPVTNEFTGAAYVYVLPSQQAVLGSAGRVANQDFATSVALSGSTAVVGAPGQNSATGAAYIYVRSGSTWNQQAQLTEPGGAPGDDFGIAVAIDGSTAVIGTPGTTSGTGAAYVFADAGGTWTRQGTLTAADGAPGDIFGHAVAISGGTIVVGAYGTKSGTGTAYVFALNAGTWPQQAELADPGGTTDDFFGYSVGISGSTAVIGAYGTNSATGAAYLFTRSGSTWSQQATLTDPGAASSDCFGYSVALSGTTAVIGAPGTNSVTGTAYVFTGTGTTWSRQATLTAADGATGDDFGYAVSVSGTAAVVGAPRQDSRTGMAYLFADSGGAWSEQAELIVANRAADGGFGASAALAGPTAVVGAPNKNSNTGAAYVFANM